MSMDTVSPQPPLGTLDDGVRRRRWTRKEYYRAAKLGLFRPEERLELLDGEIIEKMSPQLTPHATGVLDTDHQLGAAFGPGYHVRSQLPLILDDQSEPEPDAVVVPGVPRDYLASHPIIEYWIENLKDRRLEVYRDPEGTHYRASFSLGEEETISPLAAPHATIRVADLLPPKENPEA
jgi:Uma2 family endonuclease